MSGDALVVVDMQAGLLDGLPKHDLKGVIQRINAAASFVRAQSGKVVWIRHCGKAGDGFAPHEPGWAFLPDLDRQPEDLVVEKTLNDSFAGTALHDALQRLAVDRVVIAGWATDSCVDSTEVRRVARLPRGGHQRRPYAERPAASRRAHRHPASQLGLERPSDQPLDPRRDDG